MTSNNDNEKNKQQQQTNKKSKNKNSYFHIKLKDPNAEIGAHFACTIFTLFFNVILTVTTVCLKISVFIKRPNLACAL